LSEEQLYSNVLVKVGVERSHLLSKATLKRLLECKSLEELASELKETVYGKKLAQITFPYTSKIFERVFQEILIEVTTKIAQNSPETVAPFIKTYLLKFELENIKTILRAASVGLTYDEITQKLYLPVEVFIKKQDIILKAAMAIHVKSVVDILKNTVYGPLLVAGLKKYEETGSTKFFDILLDRMFYEQFGEKFKDLPKREQENAFFYVSREIDKFNILTILRAKILGHNSDWIRLAISRDFYNVTEQIIEALLLVDNFESALGIIKQSYYKNFFVETETPEESISAAEKAFRKDLFEHAKRTVVGNPFNVGTPIAFLIRKRIELENLTAISLGIEYNWKKEEISHFLFV
jgi:V/A-type H+-transporting ATPase subunit C